MEPSILAPGKSIRHREKEYSHMLMGMSTTVNGPMIKPMATVFTSTKMVRNIRDFGRMTCSMAWGWKLGRIVAGMRGSIVMAGSMDWDPTNGTMVQFSPETGLKTKSTASASTNGSMEDPTRVSGAKITWRVSESTAGKTAEFTTANTKKIRNMVTESTNGKTIENTPATGSEVNSTAWVFTQFKKRTESSMACGKMARELSGLGQRVNRKLTLLKLIIRSIIKIRRVSKVCQAIALFKSPTISKIEFPSSKPVLKCSKWNLRT
jgi:hypothetical protein